jgi:hypothetical protein
MLAQSVKRTVAPVPPCCGAASLLDCCGSAGLGLPPIWPAGAVCGFGRGGFFICSVLDLPLRQAAATLAGPAILHLVGRMRFGKPGSREGGQLSLKLW